MSYAAAPQRLVVVPPGVPTPLPASALASVPMPKQRLPPPPVPDPLDDALVKSLLPSVSAVPQIIPEPTDVVLVQLPPPIVGGKIEELPNVSHVFLPASYHPTRVQVSCLVDKVGTIQGVIKALGEAKTTPHERLARLNELVEIAQYIHDVDNYVPCSTLIKVVRENLISRMWMLRTAAVRVLTAFNKTRHFSQELVGHDVAFLVARSLERERSSRDVAGLERQEALRWLRVLMSVNPLVIPRAVVTSLCAIVEAPDVSDSFCCQCMQTLCEIAVVNPQVVWSCNGIKTIFNAALDPAFSDLMDSVVTVLVFLMDDEMTRKYVRPECDLQVLFSPLVDISPECAPTPKNPREAADLSDMISIWRMRCRASVKFIARALESWTGLIALSSIRLGLRSMVNALRMPLCETHDAIIDALFNLFHTKIPRKGNPFAQTSQQQPRASMQATRPQGVELPPALHRHHDLLDNYIAMALIAFNNAGLFEALVAVANKRGSKAELVSASVAAVGEEEINCVTKSVVLLGELLSLSNKLLHPSQCAELQLLPSLVSSAASFHDDPMLRSRASTVVSNLRTYSHMRAATAWDPQRAMRSIKRARWYGVAQRDQRLERIDDLKLKMDWAIDEAHLMDRIQETKVMLHKDWLKWEWEAIADVLEGPLTNPALVDLVLRNTQFYKRLLGFYKPRERAFSKVDWHPDNMKYVRVGCLVVENLASSEMGRQFVQEEKFLIHIAEALKSEVDAPAEAKQRAKTSGSDKDRDKESLRLFSSDNMIFSLSREYFTILGALSTTNEGLAMLRQLNVFNYFGSLAAIADREDLHDAIMKGLDYSISGEPRQILSTFLKSSSRVTRLAAVKYMRVVFRLEVGNFYQWGVELLVNRLKDEEIRVAQEALSVLDEACQVDGMCLESTVASLANPPDDMLPFGAPGHSFLLRLLSCAAGYRYLSVYKSPRWSLKDELFQWALDGCLRYQQSLETELATLVNPEAWNEALDTASPGAEPPSVQLQPHLFGELAKTEGGCAELRDGGYVDKCITQATNPALPGIQRRSSVTALGHVGMSATGFALLQEYGGLAALLSLAESSPCLSLRGTTCVALGMLCASDAARQQLAEAGWLSALDGPHAPPNTLVAIPSRSVLARVMGVPSYPYERPSGAAAPQLQGEQREKLGDAREQILAQFTTLINHVTSDDACAALVRLHRESPIAFHSPRLVFHALQLLENYPLNVSRRAVVYGMTLDSLPPATNAAEFFEEFCEASHLASSSGSGSRPVLASLDLEIVVNSPQDPSKPAPRSTSGAALRPAMHKMRPRAATELPAPAFAEGAEQQPPAALRPVTVHAGFTSPSGARGRLTPPPRPVLGRPSSGQAPPPRPSIAQPAPPRPLMSSPALRQAQAPQ
eukprot:m51a1_g8380 hypothetical protein (1387) ;mRNA; r:175253-180989